MTRITIDKAGLYTCRLIEAYPTDFIKRDIQLFFQTLIASFPFSML
jgi:hypothetical protein